MCDDMNEKPEYLKESIKVSIIVPVYNSEKYIEDTVNSILKQEFDNYEIILVDDGSKDNSGRICDELAKKNCIITVIHKENGGICSARNEGLKAAQGEYIGFCDNDDRYLPNLLRDNYTLAKKYGADIVRFNRKRVKSNRNGRYETEVNFMPKGVHFFQGEEIDKNYLCIRKCSVAVWSALYKKSFLEKHRLRFPIKAKSGLEDRIFNILAYRYCDSIVLNSKVYYVWLRREDHSTSDKFDMNIIKTIYYCIKIEKETYERRNVEKYVKGYWNNIILFYIYFCFWNINRDCCNLNILKRIQVLRNLRSYIFSSSCFSYDSSVSVKEIDKLEKKILYFFNNNKYILLYCFLKFKNQEY